MSDGPFGVVGATGQQGGAVVDALLDAGAAVRALVRDPSDEKAAALGARGVEVVAADQDDPDHLVEPLRGLAALLLMTTFAGEDGTEGEVTRGKAVADAAVAAGVPRVVYLSVGGAERGTGIPHFESKWRIEQYLGSVIDTQVVRPVFFMENVADQLNPGDDAEAVIRLPLPGDVPLQVVAVTDIGKVAAAALIDPSVLADGPLEIAGDELTGDRMAAVWGDQLGRPARYEALPVETLENDDQEAMFRWFVDSSAYHADFARTRAIDADVLDFAAWLAQH